MSAGRKQFGPVEVAVLRARHWHVVDDHPGVRLGMPIGCAITTPDAVYELPHWPSRIRNVRPVAGGVVVTFVGGATRLLGPEDAA